VTPSLVEHLNGARGDIADYAEKIEKHLADQSGYLADLISRTEEKSVEATWIDRAATGVADGTGLAVLTIGPVTPGSYWIVENLSFGSIQGGGHPADLWLDPVGDVSNYLGRFITGNIANHSFASKVFVNERRSIIAQFTAAVVGDTVGLHIQGRQFTIAPSEMAVRG